MAGSQTLHHATGCAEGEGERPDQLIGLSQPHGELHGARFHGAGIRRGVRVGRAALADGTAALTHEDTWHGELSATVGDEWAWDVSVRAVEFKMVTPVSDREHHVI